MLKILASAALAAVMLAAPAVARADDEYDPPPPPPPASHVEVEVATEARVDDRWSRDEQQPKTHVRSVGLIVGGAVLGTVGMVAFGASYALYRGSSGCSPNASSTSSVSGNGHASFDGIAAGVAASMCGIEAIPRAMGVAGMVTGGAMVVTSIPLVAVGSLPVRDKARHGTAETRPQLMLSPTSAAVRMAF